MASINLTNVGMQSSPGGTVAMTSATPQLSVEQGEATFDALATNGSQFVGNAFRFTLGDDIRDRSRVPFVLTTYFGDQSYAQEYEIEVLAPNIVAQLIAIDDVTGNQDGRLDPGEFARLTFRVVNNGHYYADNTQFTLTNDEGYIRVITTEVTVGSMEVGEEAEVSFDVYAEFSAGEVPYVSLQFLSAINGIRIEQDIACPMGYVIESFEVDDFDVTNWANDPVHPWTIDTQTAYESIHSAKSGLIDHSQSSQLTLTFTSLNEGEISFFRRISSEANYDFLIFYIDDVEQGRWSGDFAWKIQSYPTTPGLHRYKWEYLKDHSVSSGYDAAWIDYITLPPHLDDVSETVGDTPLSLHPNPTTDQVDISLEQEGHFTVKVIDANGKVVMTESDTHSVSFVGLKAGIYQVVVEQDGRRWSSKIVKM